MSDRNCIVLHGKILDRYFEVKHQYSRKLSTTNERMRLLISLGFSNLNEDELEKLLNTSDSNLIHDVQGIDSSIDRDTKTMDETFVPRSL